MTRPMMAKNMRINMSNMMMPGRKGNGDSDGCRAWTRRREESAQGRWSRAKGGGRKGGAAAEREGLSCKVDGWINRAEG